MKRSGAIMFMNIKTFPDVPYEQYVINNPYLTQLCWENYYEQLLFVAEATTPDVMYVMG